MRVRLRIASAGQGCIFRFPGGFDDDRAAARTNGVYDFDKCAAIVRKLEADGWVYRTGRDGLNATISAVDFLYNVCEICDGMMAESERNRPGDPRAPHRTATTAQDRRASRKIDQGRSSLVNVNITEGYPVRLRVSIAQKHGGDMEAQWGRDLALLCMEIANGMAEASHGKIAAEEGEGCEGLLARARELAAQHRAERERRERIEAKRECARRVNGYCSPFDASCEYYCGGRCAWKEAGK